MIIRTVDTSRKSDVNRFIDLPFRLYKECPQWVPPLRSEIILVLDRKKHPFYKHSEAEFFLAESDGVIVGRLAVIHNLNYCAYHQTSTAFFYYFDAFDDTEISRALFKAGSDWAKKRGVKIILGPKGFLRSSGSGLLTKGFEFTPALGVPYNYPYYENLFIDWGFKKFLEQYSGYLENNHKLPARLYEIADRVKKRGSFWVKSFNKTTEMRHWIPLVKTVQDEAFYDNPNYYPSTDEEFQLIAQSMIQVSRPHMIKLIMKGNDVAGFIISYPDLSAALKTAKGRIFPFGWILLILGKYFSKIVDLNGVGILPKYQGLGANAMLYVELEKTLRQNNYKRGELVQVNETNFKSVSDWENLGVHFHKTHRIYQYDIP
jgi:ribosomal protein S18 acetylase RimI-like enzyme